jgi:hypothetical protein
MKNIIKSILAVALVTVVSSCEDEQDLKYVQPAASFNILTPQSGDGVVLKPETPTNPGLVMTWDNADFGTATAVDYAIEIDKNGDDFANPVTLTTTNSNFVSVDMQTLNGASVSAGLTPFSEGGLDVRVKATTGSSDPVYSNVITYLVTPYSTENPKLWVPGNYQATSGYGNAWTHATAPTLESSGFGETDFEGYVYIATNQTDPGNDGMKFSSEADWNGTNYGDDGTFSGILSATGGNILLNAGYYLVKADTSTLTYSATPTSWAVTGSATPAGWPDNGVQDYDMTYDPATKLWTTTLNLSAGELKFRANDAWTINYGDAGGDGILDFNDGTNIQVPTAGNYLITLDLSHPRAYTYTLTLN